MLRLVRGAGGKNKVVLAGVAVKGSGARAKLKLRVELRRGRRWVTEGHAKSSANGWWNVTLARPRRGVHAFRTVLSGIATLPVKIRVR
jgi:hypothetical protein